MTAPRESKLAHPIFESVDREGHFISEVCQTGPNNTSLLSLALARLPLNITANFSPKSPLPLLASPR
jgi:hypothetical protein